jgi:hypothetical protein
VGLAPLEVLPTRTKTRALRRPPHGDIEAGHGHIRASLAAVLGDPGIEAIEVSLGFA